MAISGDERHATAAGEPGGGKLWNLCRMPFRQAGGAPAPQSSSTGIHPSAGRYGLNAPPVAGDGAGGAHGAPAASISSVAKALLPARRRLQLDPASKLYFPCERPRTHSFIRVLFSLIPGCGSEMPRKL
jgi:hypothetical protein